MISMRKKGQALKIWKALMHPAKQPKHTEKERKQEQKISADELQRFSKYPGQL